MRFEVNGVAAAAGAITLPRVGVWWADLTLDSTEFLDGNVTIKLGSLELHGASFRMGDHRQHTFARIVGGSDGFPNLFGPKAYGPTPLRVVLEDILSAAGEQLSATADQGVLATQLPRWVAMQKQCSAAITALLAAAGPDVVWRVLPDGSLWVGLETWPASSMAYDLLEEAPERGMVKVAAIDPTVLPGQSLGGRNVSTVVHRVDRQRIRTNVWFIE